MKQLISNKRLGLVLLAVGLLSTQMIFAQDAQDLFADLGDSPAASSTSTTPAEPSSSGDFQLQLSDLMSGIFRYSANASDWSYQGVKTPVLENQLGFEVKSGNIKIVSNWTIDVQPSSSLPTVLSAMAGENAIYWSPSSFKFGLGWQDFAWGVADKKNPTDNLNPRDYTVGVNADKLPVFALSANWYPSDTISFQGVYVPYEQQDKFPIDFAGHIKSSLSSLNSGVTVSVSDPAMDPASFIAGGRLAFRLPTVDFSFSYLYDWDQFYTATTTLTNVGVYVPASVHLEKLRIHRLGADIKTLAGKTGLWLEAGLNLTQDLAASNTDNIRNPSLAWTAGLDTSYGPNDAFYLNVQYLGEYVINYDQSTVADYTPTPSMAKMTNASFVQSMLNRSLTQSLGLQTEGLTQGLTVNLKFPLLDNLLTPSLTAAYVLPFMYDSTNVTRFGSLALNPELDFMPIDSFHIKLGADLCYSWIQPKDGALQQDTTSDRIGIYGLNNNVYLKVEYAFNYLLKK